MKLHYYPETDSLYIELSKEPGVETREVSDGVNVDVDAHGSPVGFDIDRAANRLDDARAIPLINRPTGGQMRHETEDP